MISPFRSALPSGDLGGMEVHVVIREFPELTPLLRERGVDLRTWGGKRLEETPSYGREWGEELLAPLAWRSTG
jgi:hypothetical protein